ncbi:peptidase M, neutral zinc metallopeptidase site [Tolypothrix sp. FACHB-123]|uniref:peptidase M, neutral zinc metallopeptidase site n=1 Tax=Tolypothrix sp. FACHB-123 TaxID=2692868 RepID=UPI0016892762|nr:peptidase M, neutral zinc metallopeptidase site [Tolypothrix sp. FACHB-123]MBD2354916.1 peptidase M, neutral zinc metallopeptidase site [Tolypothrix sp. FACHB-123]
MSFLNSFNTFSKILLGVGIVDGWKYAAQTKQAEQKSQKLAQNKQLREAVKVVEQSLAVWSRKPGFGERLLCKLLLGNLLDNLSQELQQWRKQITAADKLALQGDMLLKQDNGDPLATQTIVNAIAIYQSCSQILHDERVLELINRCQQEIQQRQLFQTLVNKARSHAENRYFQNAIAVYQKAEQLYSTEALQEAIKAAKSQVAQEKIYTSALQRAQQAQNQGRLRGAIAVLETALSRFPRDDGRELLQELQQTIKGREQFRQGLAAEKLNDFPAATSLYETAKTLLPNPLDCQIRLGIVAIKTENWAIALSHLFNLPGEQAAYLRGFVYAQQENLQQAYREWQGLSSNAISAQREILNSLAQRHRLLYLQNIEKFIHTENLELAKAATEEFNHTFGFDPLVASNLKEHIQPRIDVKIWQNSDRSAIVKQIEKDWLSQPNITNLHNLVVAIYYSQHQDFLQLSHLIITLFTALANFTENPILQDIPWLGNQPIDFNLISLELKRRLEAAIDSYKDRDVQIYLSLRDKYRLELVALKLMDEPAQRGMKINNILITPGCYQHYSNRWRNKVVEWIDSHHQTLRSLYTPWGLAIAACLEADIQRAMQLKPTTKTTNNIEEFAQKFMAYHEGCYYLSQKNWTQAITPLTEAKSEITNNPDWQQEIDRLAGLQRQAISGITEHVEFAQFWYEILGSQPARSYLAEYKAEKIREQIHQQKISLSQALKDLQEIKKIDAQNPIVLDLMEMIEFQQEIQVIEKLLKNNQFEKAVKLAKHSQQQRIRHLVADICLDILLKGFQNGDLNIEDIANLGQWAYELCPDAENVQKIYKFSQELKEIQSLMKRNRFEEAIQKAKYSQHASTRHHVAELLIMTLVKGMQKKDLSWEVIKQLGSWAYELCPDEPAFQEIFYSLKLR